MAKHKNWMFIFFLVVASNTHAYATAIIVFRSPDNIFIASDTLFIDLVNSHERRKLTACKINISDKFAFVSAGYDFSSDTSLDVRKTGLEVLHERKDMQTSAEEIVRQIKGPLLSAIIRRHNEMVPADYFEMIAKTSNVLSFAVAGLENGVPTFVGVDFTRIDDSVGNPIAVKPRSLKCPSIDCPANKKSYAVLGIADDLKPFVTTYVWSKDDVAGDVRKVIQKGVELRPDVVSLPIDVLVIDKQGRRWVQPYGKCN